MADQAVVPAQKKKSVLGMISIGLGVLAFLIAWVPCFGFVSWIFSGLGVVLAVVGMVLASDKSTGMGLPIAGLLICLLAGMTPFGATFIYARVFGDTASKELKRAGEEIKQANEKMQKEIEKQREAAEKAARDAQKAKDAQKDNDPDNKDK